MKKKWLIITCILLITLFAGAMTGTIMSNVEHPKYHTVSSIDDIEVREYDSTLIAEVQVEGTRKESISSGFKILADYIFGNNKAEQDIAMTAPVQQQSNEKIPMTAPVQQQASGNSWKVSFIMPSTYTMKTIPKPNNPKVKLKEVPKKTFIVIKFSGLNSDENIAKHEAELMKHILNNQIETLSEPTYAFYNPPWTLPFMRRNEILIEVNPG